MRVYHTRGLLRIVEGTDDNLRVKGRLGVEITPSVEAWLKELPRDVQVGYNFFTAPDEEIDFSSEPIVYMPDEFSFFCDVESLGRLAREVLVTHLPMKVSTWQTKHVPVADLWLGGEDQVLTKGERAGLQEAMREVWALPIRGKVFVVDEASQRSLAQRVGAQDAVRVAGGIVHAEVSPACDYYVTETADRAEAAQKAGAKRIINFLVLSVMVDRP